MQITKTDIGSIPLIQDLARRAWEAYRGILPEAQIAYMLGKMYSAVALAGHFQNPDFSYFLISNHQNYFGFIGLESHVEPKTAKLHRLYLVPEAKGTGLGKKALEFAKTEAAKHGDTRLILNVNKQNPAKNFYEHCGFSVIREVKLDVGEGYFMDDYEMETRL